jgi:hypothetical protein
MVVRKYLTVLSGKYPANFYRIQVSAGCLNFPGYRIPVSGSGASLEAIILVLRTPAILMPFEKFTRASFIQIALEIILIPTLQMHEINNCFKDKYLSNFFNGIDDTMRIRMA